MAKSNTTNTVSVLSNTPPTFPKPKDETDRRIFKALTNLIKEGRVAWKRDDEGELVFSAIGNN